MIIGRKQIRMTFIISDPNPVFLDWDLDPQPWSGPKRVVLHDLIRSAYFVSTDTECPFSVRKEMVIVQIIYILVYYIYIFIYIC